MAPPQTYMTASSFLGIGIETTRGTAVAPVAYLPCESPELSPMVGWLEDKGYRGSASVNYGNVPSVGHAEYSAKGNVFLDTLPYLLRAFLGSADTTVAAPGSTTLSAAPSAGATSISTAATIAAGSMIVIDTGSLIEAHSTTGVSGAGPFTVTLGEPLINAHNSGATVTGMTAHQVGQLYAPTTAHQPPSLTIVDFDGFTAKQSTGAVGDTLDLEFGADTAFTWSAKFIGNPHTTVGTPSQSFSSEIFVPGYSVNLAVAGTQSVVVANGALNLKRSSEAIQTADGNAAPLVNFAGPIELTGKLTFVVITGDNTLTAGTTYLKQSHVLMFTEPTTGHGLRLQMSQVQYDSPKVNRGKNYVEVDTNFKAEANATDGLSGGYASLLTRTGNAKSSAY